MSSNHKLKIIGIFVFAIVLALTMAACDTGSEDHDVGPTMYELTIDIEGKGEVLDDDGEEILTEEEESETLKVEEDTFVTLEAEPTEDWIFLEWTGDKEDEEKETSVLMDEDKNVKANFEEAKVHFAVDIVEEESNFKVGYGQEFQIAVDINNEGNISATQEIEVIVDEEVRAYEEVTLDGTQNQQITLEFAAEVEDDGEKLKVKSEDDDSSEGVEVITDELEKIEDFKAEYDEEFDLGFIEEGTLEIKFVDDAAVLALPEKVDVGEGNYVERYSDEIKLEEKGSFIEGIEFGWAVDFSEENLQDMRGEDAGEPVTFTLLDGDGEMLTELTAEIETD